MTIVYHMVPCVARYYFRVTRPLRLGEVKAAMSLANTLKTKATSWMARQWRAKPARLAGHRPIASITFDDFPKNAWEQGGVVLARHRVRGTYYTAGGFCGRTEDGTVFYDGADLE